jgi:acylphosphatase
MATIRVRVIVSGRVQGVYFRSYTAEEARARGVSGWIKNRRDGRVEALFEGEEQAVQQMVDWCAQGPPAARVEDIEVYKESFTGEYDGFSVTFEGGRL